MTQAVEPFILTPPAVEDGYDFEPGADFYVLDARRRPIPATEEQAEAVPEEDMLVAETEVGDRTIVTEFLGYDAAGDGGPPLFFKTAVRGLPPVGQIAYMATYQEALADHRRTVEYCRRMLQHAA